MPHPCEEFEILISGFVDGELSTEDRKRLDAHIATCSSCAKEMEHVKRIVLGTNQALVVDEPPPEVWDTFLDGVYNRMERRFGWFLLIIGLVTAAGVGIVMFEMAPGISLLTKVFVTVPVSGLIVLFVSVFRQRMVAAKTDRYSREVQR